VVIGNSARIPRRRPESLVADENLSVADHVPKDRPPLVARTGLVDQTIKRIHIDQLMPSYGKSYLPLAAGVISVPQA
jgi:hypothetical protein